MNDNVLHFPAGFYVQNSTQSISLLVLLTARGHLQVEVAALLVNVSPNATPRQGFLLPLFMLELDTIPDLKELNKNEIKKNLSCEPILIEIIYYEK